MSVRHQSTLSGWGRLPAPGREVLSEDLEKAVRGRSLTRGLGRSYGDSSLPPPGKVDVAGSMLADRILAFDPQTGVLLAEAGFSLGALNQVFWPQGFASPVSTGTQYVTLGGMVAADVHGKNHHRVGTFGAHVRRLKMSLAGGEVVWCSRQQKSDLFFATLGGMGLTGHILEVEVGLESIPSPWIWAESERIPSLDRFLIALKEAAEEWPFTVGWIDCLKRGRHMGRGILMRGRWAEKDEAPVDSPPAKRRFTVPVEAPSWVLNRLSARAFNAVYYGKHVRRQIRGIAHPETFFHPLDFVVGWNKIYGSRGFVQYACVIPYGDDPRPVRQFLDLLTGLKVTSFLSVLKDFGAEGDGLLSFPRPGMSICLDIPARPGTADTVATLDDFLISCGGRIYLAKDSCTTAERFRVMEPRLEAWQAVRRKWDPQQRLASAQSVRLLGDIR